MRPSRTVARAALAAALALGALPGLVGSSEPSQERVIDAAAFRNVNLATSRDRQGTGPGLPGAAGPSDGALDAAGVVVDPSAIGSSVAAGRPQPVARGGGVAWSWRSPRYTMSGVASFYDNGTTAMRLPSGTVVVICGAGGCVERVVNDFGPASGGGRVVDLERSDFFRVCGCGWWSGTTQVTIRVY